MFRGSELNTLQQTEIERTLRMQIRELLRSRKVGYVYGGLACGSDIIIVETALEFGAEINAVLPFNVEKFVETSIRIGDPVGASGKWEKRFCSILGQSKAVIIMESGKIPARNLDGYFYHAFRYAAGMALQRASLLNTQCRMIAISDQRPAHNVAGPNQAQGDWQAHGRSVDIIAYPYARTRRLGPKRPLSEFRPIICIWAPPLSKQNRRKAFEGLLDRMAPGVEHLKRMAGDDSVRLIGTSIKQALDVAFAIIKHAKKEQLALRILCDFGCMPREDKLADNDSFALIQARGDGVAEGLPATQAFAMEAKYELDDAIKLISLSSRAGRNNRQENCYMIQPVTL
jgi:hypothetical protein